VSIEALTASPGGTGRISILRIERDSSEREGREEKDLAVASN